MSESSNRFLAAVLFTVLLIVLVNLAWWLYYNRTEGLLEHQLSRRLSSIAVTATEGLPRGLVDSLLFGDIDAYDQVSVFLEKVRAANGVADLFVVDENYRYLANTSMEPDSIYFLSDLNGKYIDSLFYSEQHGSVVTPTYRSGDIFLKSAFAPLVDPRGITIGVLGVEANVDYFDSLTSLRHDLWYATVVSLIGGLVLGLLFLALQRRLSRAEQNVFLSHTHAYLGRMVAVVAHEIRNPLMIIRASAERLSKRTPAEESRYIIEETDRLNEIVTGYLDFARAEGPFLSGERPESIDVAEFVSGVKKHLFETYQPEEIQWLDSSIPQGLNMIGYRRSLRQVLLNLLMNGAEACQSVSKPIAVGLSVADKGHRIEIAVRDKGSGITGKELKRLFTPFYTTKQKGSGLGLYLSQKIVAEMGGMLKIDSQPGSGTDVTISLPRTART
jgi:signal transduction histidine kinase